MVRVLLVLLFPVFSYAGVIGLDHTQRIQKVVKVRHKIRKDAVINGGIIFDVSRVYNPADTTVHAIQFEANFNQTPTLLNDRSCDTALPLGSVSSGVTRAPWGTGLEISMQDFNNPNSVLGAGPFGLRPHDTNMFPRVAHYADMNPFELKFSAPFQMDVDGKDVAIELSRGDIVQGDFKNWGRDCPNVPTLPLVNNGQAVQYREWHLKLNIDAKDYIIDYLVPEMFGKYVYPDSLNEFVTEFFEFPGFKRGYMWDIEVQTEGSDTWIPLTSWNSSKLMLPGFYGVRVATYKGKPALELSNDGSDSYVSNNTVFTVPSTASGVTFKLPVANFSVESQTVSQDVGTVTATVNLDRASTKDLYIPVDVSGTAKYPDHVSIPNSGMVKILAGQLSGKITFTVKSNPYLKEDRTVVLKFLPPVCHTAIVDGVYKTCGPVRDPVTGQMINDEKNFVSTGVIIGEHNTHLVTILKTAVPQFDPTPAQNLSVVGGICTAMSLSWDNTNKSVTSYDVYSYPVDWSGNVIGEVKITNVLVGSDTRMTEVDQFSTQPGLFTLHKYKVIGKEGSNSTPAVESGVTGPPSCVKDSSGNYLPYSLPTVSLLTPLDKEIHFSGEKVNLTVSAWNNYYGIASIDYLSDGVVVGRVSRYPYSLTLPVESLGDGKHSIIARAYNGIGQSTNSAIRTINVAITKPSPPTEVTASAVTGGIQIKWKDSVASGGRTILSYIVNKSGLPYASTSSLSLLNTEGTLAGNQYCYSVSSVDSMGLVSGASSVVCALAGSVVVDPPPPPQDTILPVVTFVSPANGSTVLRRSRVVLSATATDNSGVITKVSFYVDGSLKCTATVSPYKCTWTVPNRRSGTFRIEAKATDPSGNIGSKVIVVYSR